jgi:hypothetical protein
MITCEPCTGYGTVKQRDKSLKTKRKFCPKRVRPEGVLFLRHGNNLCCVFDTKEYPSLLQIFGINGEKRACQHSSKLLRCAWGTKRSNKAHLLRCGWEGSIKRITYYRNTNISFSRTTAETHDNWIIPLSHLTFWTRVLGWCQQEQSKLRRYSVLYCASALSFTVQMSCTERVSLIICTPKP